MKVFKIQPDPDRYQYFLVTDRRLVESDELKFDGTIIENWQPPEVLSYEPKHRAGDFWAFEVYSWATRPKATELVERFLLLAGQLLPLPFEGETFALLNVTQCVSCLDHERTEWVRADSTGAPLWISKYAFRRDLMPESSIFKIPETAQGEMLCYEGLKGPEDEFKPVVEQRGLEGLRFVELWDSDS